MRRIAFTHGYGSLACMLVPPILAAAVVLLLAVPALAQDTLPSGASFRLKELDRILAKGERVMGEQSTNLSTDYRVTTAQAAVKSGRAKMDEIQDRFGSQIPAGNAEMEAAYARIDALEAAADALQAGDIQKAAEAQAVAADMETASADWLTALKPYVIPLGRPDHNRDKYLIPSATQEEEEMAKRMAIYAEAEAALKEFRASPSAEKKTDELATVEEDLDRALQSFAESCREYALMDLEEAERELGYAADFVSRQEAKKETSETLLTLQKSQITRIQTLIERGAAAAGPDDPRPAQLRNRLRDLERRDEAIRHARIDQTLMKPDGFTGSEASQIKTKAGELLQKKHPDARILRTTVISNDWKEESRWEPTDGTYSALRFRTTRSVTAQIAGKRGNDVVLYTIDVSKDRLSDGSWGPYYGHVMFTDPMRESNVNK
ncbi:hypothetical protein JXA88_07480 [Candidatus Fermentibacteria bacterium]|nr:hypothetical protein [Candidatus Fermentibacteria bacterium]